MHRAAPVLLCLLALLLHALWAWSIPVPEDWDAQYYLLVARHLVAGEGAVTGSLWNLAVQPERLPLAADLHWMPLPSRVLLPGLWLWPARGDQLITLLLASTWAPLAWALARRALSDDPARERVAMLAGLLAALGGLYPRLLSTPDSYALYGAIGGAGLLAAAHRRLLPALLLGAAAALSRNDGFLLAPCLALAFGWRRGLLVAASGPLASGLWALRSLAVAGEPYLHARWLAANADRYVDLYLGRTEAMDLGERLGQLLAAAPQVAEAWVLPGLAVLSLPAFWAAWQRRDEGWVRASLAYTLLMPPVVVFLAPVIATHGTLPRSLAGVYVAHCALGAIGAVRLGRWAARRRGYPPAFLPALLVLAFAAISTGMGVQRVLERDPAPCALLADLPEEALVFSAEPLALEAACGRSGVVLLGELEATQAAELAQRYDVRHALISEGLDEGGLTASALRLLLPGWAPTDEARLWQAP